MNNWKTNKYLYSILTEFLIENKIKFKTNVRTLCKKNGWELCPYPENIKYLEFCKISEDGFSIYKDNDFYIFYNPFQQAGRINFTIAHEIGHIALYHHALLRKTILAKGSNDLSEYQANIFAQNILMPISITKEQMEIKNEYELAEQFEVSPSMVKTRISKLNNDIKWFKYIFNNKNK